MHQLGVHGFRVEPVEWEAVRRAAVREPRPELAQQVDLGLLGPAHRRAAFPSSLKLLRDLRARAHVGPGSVATPRRHGAEHMCCGCAHHVVQPLAVRRDIHLLRALLTVRLTRIGSSVACRCTPMLCSHHWKGWSSCRSRVGSVLARRATDEQISRRRVLCAHRVRGRA